LEQLYLTNKDMRSFIERAMHIAAIAMGLLYVISVNAAPLPDCKAFDMRDGGVAPNSFHKTAAMPSYIQAGIGVPGLALPLQAALSGRMFAKAFPFNKSSSD